MLNVVFVWVYIVLHNLFYGMFKKKKKIGIYTLFMIFNDKKGLNKIDICLWRIEIFLHLIIMYLWYILVSIKLGLTVVKFVKFLQVIALICGLIVIVLMLLTLTSTDWLLSAGWRQGLFSHCIALHAPTPLPFNVPNNGPDCYPTREVGMFYS